MILLLKTNAALGLYQFQTYLTSSEGEIQLATCKARQLLPPHPESRQPLSYCTTSPSASNPRHYMQTYDDACGILTKMLFYVSYYMQQIVRVHVLTLRVTVQTNTLTFKDENETERCLKI
jgi:hypothetical protein